MCIFRKVAECERMHGANVDNNEAFPRAVALRPILPWLVDLEDMVHQNQLHLQRQRQNLDMLQVLADIRHDIFATIVIGVDDDVRRIVSEDSLAERSPKEKKRERRLKGTANGKKAVKQAKAADQRRMKLQYKSDRKSHKSHSFPARFVRR